MSATMMLPWLLGAFSLGLLIGGALANRRWRGNARQVFRVASGGRLYKVTDVTPWGSR